MITWIIALVVGCIALGAIMYCVLSIAKDKSSCLGCNRVDCEDCEHF